MGATDAWHRGVGRLPRPAGCAEGFFALMHAGFGEGLRRIYAGRAEGLRLMHAGGWEDFRLMQAWCAEGFSRLMHAGSEDGSRPTGAHEGRSCQEIDQDKRHLKG